MHAAEVGGAVSPVQFVAAGAVALSVTLAAVFAVDDCAARRKTEEPCTEKVRSLGWDDGTCHHRDHRLHIEGEYVVCRCERAPHGQGEQSSP